MMIFHVCDTVDEVMHATRSLAGSSDSGALCNPPGTPPVLPAADGFKLVGSHGADARCLVVGVFKGQRDSDSEQAPELDGRCQ